MNAKPWLIAAALIVSGCGRGEDKPADKAADNPAELRERFAGEFASERGCSVIAGSEIRLVRSFILSMTNYLPAPEREKAAAPFLRRLAAGKEDGFAVYRDYRNAVHARMSRFTHEWTPPAEGWAIMDRYAAERPDFSSTEISCSVAVVRLAGIDYVGYEQIAFPRMTNDKGQTGTVGVLTIGKFVRQQTNPPELYKWGFGVQRLGDWGESATWVGYEGERAPGLETIK